MSSTPPLMMLFRRCSAPRPLFDTNSCRTLFCTLSFPDCSSASISRSAFSCTSLHSWFKSRTAAAVHPSESNLKAIGMSLHARALVLPDSTAWCPLAPHRKYRDRGARAKYKVRKSMFRNAVEDVVGE
eukprot:64688-Rhodomonas_salina.6